MKVLHERYGELTLPDFLVVGAAKSATTSLYHYLSQHPQICMSSVKENWFFSFFENPPQYSSPGVLSDMVTSVDDYVELFAGARPGQLLGDASPSYLYTYEDTIANIRKLYPADSIGDLRIVISLREPVSRAYSQFWTFKRWVEEPLEFDQAIDPKVIEERLRENWNIFYDYVGFGLYYQQVKAFIDAFGHERVLVVLFDDFRKDQVGVCKTIYSFIGADSSFSPRVWARHNDITGEPRITWIIRALTSRNPVKRAAVAVIPKFVRDLIKYSIAKILLRRKEMNDAVRQELTQAYADEIPRLESLIGRDLSHWR